MNNNQKFFAAAKDGDIDRLKYYLQKGTSIDITDTTEGFEGFTALHWAIQYQHADAVQYLLKAGANPDHKSQNDTSPLCRAVYTHCVQEGSGEATKQIVSLLKTALIQHYDDPQALLSALTYENIDGFTPRYLAAYHSNAVMKELENSFLDAKAKLFGKEKMCL